MTASRSTTDASFADDVLGSDKPVLVQFWAEWCPPCRAVSPIVEQIAVDHQHKLEVYRLNVDENPATAARFGISSIPALKVFTGGQVVREMVGAAPQPVLEANLLTDVLA